MLVEDDWDDGIIEEETNDVKGILGCLGAMLGLVILVSIGFLVLSIIIWEIVEFVKGYK
jgi:hypothetical protein